MGSRVTRQQEIGQDSQKHMTPIREFDVSRALPGSAVQEAYRRDGVACLRNAHDKPWLSLIGPVSIAVLYERKGNHQARWYC